VTVPAPTRFDRDTAVTPLGGGRFAATMDRGWWIERGPNGGYLAAVLLRALSDGLGDPGRAPRSLTVHFLAPPAEGPCEIAVTVERTGRTLAYLSARLSQGDRLLALALAAFAAPLDGPSFHDLVPPPAVPASHAWPMPTAPVAGGPEIPLRERYESRWAIGTPPLSGRPAAQAVAGGWIRLTEPRPVDHLLVAAFTDAWLPPVFTRLDQRLAVPTVDLTIHFRAPLPLPTMADDDFCLVVFRTQVAAEGFIEEDGEVWSPDGVLLAHSRQLAVLL
jgi:acyl-CoA thioesterase